MEFRPSAHSYGEVTAPPADAAAVPGLTPFQSTAGDISTGVQLATSLFQTGAVIAEQVRAAKQRKDAKKAKKKRKAPAPTALAPVAPQIVTTSPVPAPPAPPEGMQPWMKWAIGGVAVIAVGFIAWKFLGPKPEPESPPRRNPKPSRPKPPPRPQPVKRAPMSSASMFRDEPTERVIDEAVERAHGEDYEPEEPQGDFDYGGEENE